MIRVNHSGKLEMALVAENKVVSARLLCKSPGILAGLPFANAIFNELNLTVHWQYPEGKSLNPNPTQLVGDVMGRARNVLLAERVVINVLSQCSGVATQERRVRALVEQVGWKGKIAGTRKTTPGFQMVEKYGLVVGEVSGHRYDLSHMIMIKDNHIVISGSVSAAVNAVRRARDIASKVLTECRNLEEAQEAARLGVDVIMLDNFDKEDLEIAARILKKSYPDILIEASGGVTVDTVADYAKNFVDIISLSQLFYGNPVDFSMKVVP
ncbi:unnamed protein product [Medioppia subpectinata]|uniref:Nicotinate-nucleotide pyrophosphorylase [carboxylating] n=1 Tax=Medioppia subpectinata TaxID=1979941 RepID=A0A7R9PWQ3_9ACAR|nr:unnamed protein product [Medioppia subpectinata]CAG2104028.1 unnamed protein product [Medioppia subpectinata]